MGLDQYIFKRLYGEEKVKNGNQDLELFYWRKHHILNNWIAEEVCPADLHNFNCEEIELSEEDIMKLFNLVISGELDKWRYSSYNEEPYTISKDREYDLEFIKTALGHIKNGDEIYYYAWW